MSLMDLVGGTLDGALSESSAMELEGVEADVNAGARQSNAQQQQQHGEEAGARAGGEASGGDAPEEKSAAVVVLQWISAEEEALGNANVRGEIIAFAGKLQFFFLGLVSRAWRQSFEGQQKVTADSEIVNSVRRATEALGGGWAAGNEAWKCAAALGHIEVLHLLLKMSDPRDEDWGEWGEWGDGIFAAAAAAGQDEVLKLLIVEGCYKDEMGLKALELAIESGRADMLACCDITDVSRDVEGSVAEKKFAAADALVTPPLKLAVAARDYEMVRLLSRFLEDGGGWMNAQLLSYAENGDLEMIRSLEEIIMCDDGRHEALFCTTFWTAACFGRFSAVALLLTWWWEAQTAKDRAETGGQNLVPDGVLFMVARLGDLKMLQWCKTNCPVVGVGFCIYCASADGWSRVPADAAGAGHVDLVLWCLDNGWEYTEGVMEAAAKEGRSNVIVALMGRGFSCRVHVEHAAASDVAGDDLYGRYVCDLARCEWH